MLAKCHSILCVVNVVLHCVIKYLLLFLVINHVTLTDKNMLKDYINIQIIVIFMSE